MVSGASWILTSVSDEIKTGTGEELMGDACGAYKVSRSNKTLLLGTVKVTAPRDHRDEALLFFMLRLNH